MQHSENNPQTVEQLVHYCSHSSLPTQQETLGRVVTDILLSGKNLTRKAICTRLLIKLEHATDAEEERHYQQLIGLLFGRSIG